MRERAKGKAAPPAAPRKKRLILSHEAHTDIAHFIRIIDKEIGGFGYLTRTEEGDYRVDEVFLAKQVVTGGSVDFLDSGLEAAIMKAVEDDKAEQLLFCWHSHVDFGAHWSATDETMIRGMNNGMTPYFVSLVQNKKGEWEARVDFFNPEGPLGDHASQIKFDLDLVREQPPTPEHITKQFEEMVEVYEPTPTPKVTHYGGQWSQGRFFDEGSDDDLPFGSRPIGVGYGERDIKLKGALPANYLLGFSIDSVDRHGTRKEHHLSEHRVKFLLDKLADKGWGECSAFEREQLVVINEVKYMTDRRDKMEGDDMIPAEPKLVRPHEFSTDDLISVATNLALVPVWDANNRLREFVDIDGSKLTIHQARQIVAKAINNEILDSHNEASKTGAAHS